MIINRIKNCWKLLNNTFNRWINCTRGIHYRMEYYDGYQNIAGERKCLDCGLHEPAIVWPMPVKEMIITNNLELEFKNLIGVGSNFRIFN